MGKELGLLSHCTDTYSEFNVTKTILDQWHRSPKILESGEYRYFGKNYKNIESIPLKEVHKGSFGRGWTMMGYRDLIKRNGLIINITPHNNDGFISSNEITNGAFGYNSNYVHVCLEGGRSRKYSGIREFLDYFTEEQYYSYINYIRDFIQSHPDGVIGGHNMISKKYCPGFDVPEFLKLINVPNENIFRI